MTRRTIDELLDAAVCGDITIEVTFPELATVWTAITVRVLEAGQPVRLLNPDNIELSGNVIGSFRAGPSPY